MPCAESDFFVGIVDVQTQTLFCAYVDYDILFLLLGCARFFVGRGSSDVVCLPAIHNLADW